MRGFALHIRLLASVLLRHWRRSELRPGRGGRSSLGRASAGVMLRMFLACYVTFGAFQWGALYADAASGDVVRKGAWLVGWAFVLAVLYGFLARAPRERAVRPVFQNPFLEALPLHRAAVGVMHVLVYVLLHVAFGTLLAGYATGGPAKYMAGLGGFALSCMAFAFGSALAEVMRVTLSVERAVIVSRWLSYSTSVPTLALLFGRRLRLEHVPAAGRMMADVLEPFVAGLRDPTRAWQMVPYVLVVALAVYALERSVRRVGADERNVLAGATKVVRSAGRVGTANVDVVLDARERYRMSFPVATFVNLALVAIVAWMRVDGAVGSAAPFHVLVVTLLIYGMLITIAMAMGLANRCVTRDLAARPFLTPLPLAPNVLVGARSRWIAKYALVASLPLLAIPILSEPYLGEMALRGFAALASAWLAGFAAPCVVFLSASAYGVEGSAVRGHMAERLLLTIFALAPVAAPNVPAGLVSLTVLGAFAVVTRQSAERCVRWIDDPEDFVREIPVWRALLSFGAFVSAQAVVMLLVGLVTKNTALVAAISYMVSGLLLMALTWADRRGLPPLVVRPRRLVHLVWGGLGGLLSVGCALGYTRLLVALDIRESGAVLSVDAGVLLLAFAVVIVAPIGEELFFRGWLQDAVDHEYARGRRWFAPLVTAAAFAAIHPPLGMPAVLVLGLIAGLLYQRTRSLLPAVLAHAIHNAAVVFLSVP